MLRRSHGNKEMTLLETHRDAEPYVEVIANVTTW